MYTNIVNIPDSILFLTSCRLAIKESVLLNEDLEKYTKLGLVDFVMNEATDYQIMNIVVNDEFVEEKYNLEGEIDLFNQYKEMVVENIQDFAFMESEDLKSLLYEVGPISSEGLSTAAPILEFLYESGILAEKEPTMVDVAKKWKDKVGQKAADAKFDAQFKARALKKKVPHKLKGAYKTAKDKAAAAKGKAGEMVGKAKDKAAAAKFDAQFKARGLKKSIPHRLKGMKATGVEKTKAALGTKAGKAGAVALGAAAIYAGVKAYQRFMSQAARACGGQSGGAKTACMQKYKANALKGQIAATQRGASSCGQAKDPAKCKAAIDARVQKLKGKLAKVGA